MVLGLLAVLFFTLYNKDNDTAKSEKTDITAEENEDEASASSEEEFGDHIEELQGYGNNGSQVLRHSPNMYVDWVSSENDGSMPYECYVVNWKCTETADETYWAVHNWESGYAGFQDRGYDRVILLSLWNLPDGTTPDVEYYSSDLDFGDFDHEGSGAYVFTPYQWEVGVWYSMKIEITYENGKTIFTQYVCEEGEDWIRTAALSYPTYVEIYSVSSVFQEDYGFTGMRRSCELRNAAGRFANGDWDHQTKCTISSSYYPDNNDDNAMWDVNFGCDYAVYDNVVKIISDGTTDESNGKKMPYRAKLRH